MTICDDTDTNQIAHTTNHVDGSCLCLAFSDVNCVPRFKSADQDIVIIETYVSNRADISELVDRLKAVTEQVSLRRLTASHREGAVESTPTTVELSTLTSKQREAAMIAVSEGYYRTPRETGLGELAATLDISKSALSQRLRAVEAKLTTAAFDTDQ
jgi:predicted DNA binding protein